MLQRWQIAGNTGSRSLREEMQPLVCYVIQDLCCLSCQEQKSIRLELEANPGAQRRRTLSLWISHVGFESFLTHSTWQCRQQHELRCELEPREPTVGTWTEERISATDKGDGDLIRRSLILCDTMQNMPMWGFVAKKPFYCLKIQSIAVGHTN